MNAEQTSNTGQGNGIVFLIGAVYNILAGLEFSSLLDKVIEAVVGGLAFLLVQAIAKAVTPFLKKLKDRIVKFFTKKSNED
jgi:hypothetical protein